MSQQIVKNSRRIFSINNADDPAINSRITVLENNEYKITYFEAVGTAAGTITIPTGATILLDQLAGGIDAYVSTITNGQPTGDFPVTAGGVTVDVSSFNALGNYSLTGTPSSFPVAIIYVLKIKAKDFSNLVTANILDLEDVGAERLANKATDFSVINNTLYPSVQAVSNYVTGFGYVPQTRTLTINGTAQDLSANRTWSVGTILGSLAATVNLIPYTTGVANTITSSTNFKWDNTNKELYTGDGTSETGFDVAGARIKVMSTGAATRSVVTLINTGSGNSLTGFYFGQTTSNYAAFLRLNSTHSGNMGGAATSIPNANICVINNIIGGAVGSMFFGNAITYMGNVASATNIGFVNDSVGVRIDQVQNLHTTNLNPFTVKGNSHFGSNNTAAATVHITESTLGNPVFRYTTTATNDDPTVITYQNRIATTDATITTLHTVSIPSTTTVLLTGFVVARRTGGAAGTAEDGAAYKIEAVYKNVAGTTTLIGGGINAIGEDQGAWDVTLVPSGATVLIRATGAVNNNITWHLSKLQTMNVGS